MRERARELRKEKRISFDYPWGSWHCTYLNCFLITDNDNDLYQKGSPLLLMAEESSTMACDVSPPHFLGTISISLFGAVAKHQSDTHMNSKYIKIHYANDFI